MSAKLMWNSLSFSKNTFKPSVLITSVSCEVQKDQVLGPGLRSQQPKAVQAGVRMAGKLWWKRP